LQVRDNGLWCKPVFSNDGLALLEQQRLFFSGRWSSNYVGEEEGKQIFRPAQLKSVGLTDSPNLPVHFVNEREKTDPQDLRMKKSVLALLTAFQVDIANDATDEQIKAVIKKLVERAHTAEATVQSLTAQNTELANDKARLETEILSATAPLKNQQAELSAAQTQFSNERASRIEELLDVALAEGRITAAQRPQWKKRLDADFANEAVALRAEARKLKISSEITDVAARKVDIANAADRHHTVQTVVRQYMERNKCNYDTAFAAVRAENPALFQAMKQPNNA